MQIRRHTLTAQTAYADLVSLLLDETVSDLRGTPTPRTRNGQTYWYDRYRVGTEMREAYLGKETDKLRARIAHHASLKEARDARRRERSRLVRLLRSERVAGMDGATGSLVAALAKAGVFRLGGTLVGTMAFRMYEGELGLQLGLDQAAATNDIDIASFERLSLALSDTVAPPLDDVFRELAFEPVPGIGDGRDRSRAWRWRHSSRGASVEFLTPSFYESEGLRDLAALGVSARSLHYLNYLIAGPIPAAGLYRDGILVSIPRPERFAIHKLIVADRRHTASGTVRLKANKDLLQAELLVTVLAEDRPEDLALAYQEALAAGPRWRAHLQRSLNRTPRVAEMLADLAE